MKRRAFILAIAFATFACREEVHPPPTTPAPDRGQATRPIVQSPPPQSPDGGPSAAAVEEEPPPAPTDGLLERLRSAPLKAARPISKRSLSLKLWLHGDTKAVFKPLLKGNDRAINEVAAYRMAKHLGIVGVPPSTVRALPLWTLVNLVKKTAPDVAESLTQNALTDERGTVTGAMIHWVSDMAPGEIEKLGGIRGITAPLRSIEKRSNESRLIARSSDMTVFDYLTGNWDRFSGGNLFVSRDGERLVLIDNNATFSHWSDRQEEKMEARLKRTNRFSKTLAARIAALTPTGIDRALAPNAGQEDPDLLSPGKIALMLERRDRLIEHIEELIKKHGREKVLSFP